MHSHDQAPLKHTHSHTHALTHSLTREVGQGSQAVHYLVRCVGTERNREGDVRLGIPGGGGGQGGNVS